jgi:lipoprotein-releasing system ATP-binding protein
MISPAQTESFSTVEVPTRSAKTVLVRAERLRKTFRSGPSEVTALAGANLALERGQMMAVIGPSGAGKSTLLHLLGALDTPTSGTVYFGGKMISALSEAELADLRGCKIGFVWQRHHLLPDFTAAENVAMPLLLRGVTPREAGNRATHWLNEVGLGERVDNRTSELSGGEQQRVAIARALVGGPQLLLADEPTGDLDEGNAETIFGLIQRLHQSLQLTSIIATHNLSLARRADCQLLLERGMLHSTGEAFALGPDAGPAGNRPSSERESQVTRV